MKRLLFFVGLGLAIIGCGGGGTRGTGPGGAPSATTREAVKQSSARSLFGAAQSGALGFAAGEGSGTTGGTTGGTSGGGGFGFPNLGGFIHQFAPVPGRGAMNPLQAFRMNRAHHLSMVRGETSTGTTGSGTSGTSSDGVSTDGGGGTDGTATDGTATDGGSTGGTGGGGWADFYYDDYLGLWVDTASTDNSFTQTLYLDEAKTEPAGSFETVFPSGWDTFPYEYRSTFEITAGNFAGAHGRYVTTVTSDTQGSSSYENVWPGYGSDQGSWTWSGFASTWTYEGHAEDGSWYKGNGSFSEDGHGTSNFADSFGYKFAYVYNADGSGSARIEGPEKGLPATMTWTAAGHVKIVWADGTVEEWDLWDWFGEGDGGGTSTTGSSGSTGSTGSGGRPNRRN